MFDIVRKEIEWGGRTLSIETGRIARQADGAVLVSYGESSVLCTAVGQTQAEGRHRLLSADSSTTRRRLTRRARSPAASSSAKGARPRRRT